MAIEAKLAKTGTVYQWQNIKIRVVNKTPDKRKHALAVSCPLFEKAVIKKMRKDMDVPVKVVKTGTEDVTVKYKGQEEVKFSLTVEEGTSASLESTGAVR